MTNFYQPSGKFSPLSIVFFIIACLTVFPLLGLIYAYAIWYIPIPYINFFIAAGFGIGVGYIVKHFVIKMGKVRNPRLAFFFGLLGALVALYFHWAVWADLVINVAESYGTEDIGIAVSNISFIEVFALATQPGALFGLIGEINKYGTWGIGGGGAVSGIMLTIIWIIEAIIVIVPSIMGRSVDANKPFCEENQKWFEEKQLPAFVPVHPNEVVEHVSNGNIDFFEQLAKVNPDHNSHSVFTLYANATNENYLTITNQIAGTNDKGEIKFEESPVVTNISLQEDISNILEAK